MKDITLTIQEVIENGLLGSFVLRNGSRIQSLDLKPTTLKSVKNFTLTRIPGKYDLSGVNDRHKNYDIVGFVPYEGTCVNDIYELIASEIESHALLDITKEQGLADVRMAINLYKERDLTLSQIKEYLDLFDLNLHVKLVKKVEYEPKS